MARGRKKLPDGIGRDGYMSVRVTAEEKVWLASRARDLSQRTKRRISMSEVVHSLLEREIRAQGPSRSSHH